MRNSSDSAVAYSGPSSTIMPLTELQLLAAACAVGYTVFDSIAALGYASQRHAVITQLGDDRVAVPNGISLTHVW